MWQGFLLGWHGAVRITEVQESGVIWRKLGFARFEADSRRQTGLFPGTVAFRFVDGLKVIELRGL
jgi:hypothetical protein